MNEIELIIHQLKTTFDGRAFHGPSFMDTLKGVDAEEARRRPIEGRHTIWEIVNHCRFWMEAVIGSLRGEEMPRVETEAHDWPAMGETETEWANAREELRKTLEGLVDAVSGFDESRMDDTVPGRSYKYRKMIHGISDHNVYHAGQIAVFRKKR